MLDCMREASLFTLWRIGVSLVLHCAERRLEIHQVQLAIGRFRGGSRLQSPLQAPIIRSNNPHH